MMIVNRKKRLNRLMRELKMFQLLKIFKNKMILLTKNKSIKIIKIRFLKTKKKIK